MKTALLGASLLALGFVLAGCGGSDTTGLVGNKNPRIRAVNDFSDTTAVNADVSGTTLLTSQAFGTVSGYAIVNNGNRTITFTNVSGGTPLPLVNQTTLLQENQYYTAIGAGTGTAGRHIILLTDGQNVLSNMTKVRVVNADEDQAAIDVYYTSTSTPNLTGQTPQVTNLAFADQSPTYVNFTPGTYKVWITPTGSTTAITSQTVTLTTNSIETLVFAKTSGGTTIQTLQDRPLPAGTP